jgi:NADPH-dependent 2,4-dienoyl-CoA reductase/sulfur reductase-like enzyme
VRTGGVREEAYDALVLSTGANAIRPPLPGIDLPGIYVLRTIPDSRKIRKAVESASRAVVVGGGMIGLEMAENLVHRGLEVTLVELAPQVLPVLDAEMAVYVTERMTQQGVRMLLDQSVSAFAARPEGGLRVETSKGEAIDTDLVILGLGVRPASGLAADAGLQLGERGAVVVNEFMQTSDPHIWAVGDMVASEDIVTHVRQPVPLAGPANRQGRMAASSALRSLGDPACLKRPRMSFRGIQGTAVCGAFGLTVAATGATEKALLAAGVTDYQKIYLHPGNHASYFPDAKPIHLKLTFSPTDGAGLSTTMSTPTSAFAWPFTMAAETLLLGTGSGWF